MRSLFLRIHFVLVFAFVLVFVGSLALRPSHLPQFAFRFGLCLVWCRFWVRPGHNKKTKFIKEEKS